MPDERQIPINYCRNCPEEPNYPCCDVNYPCPYQDDDDSWMRCQVCGFRNENCIC